MNVNYATLLFRSAAYAKLKNYTEALKDAESTVAIKADWPKVCGGRRGKLIIFSTYCIYLVFIV